MDEIHYKRRAIEGVAEAEIKNLSKIDLSKPNLEWFTKSIISPFKNFDSLNVSPQIAEKEIIFKNHNLKASQMLLPTYNRTKNINFLSNFKYN